MLYLYDILIYKFPGQSRRQPAGLFTCLTLACDFETNVREREREFPGQYPIGDVMQVVG